METTEGPLLEKPGPNFYAGQLSRYRKAVGVLHVPIAALTRTPPPVVIAGQPTPSLYRRRP